LVFKILCKWSLIFWSSHKSQASDSSSRTIFFSKTETLLTWWCLPQMKNLSSNLKEPFLKRMWK
jgi:hypothetical protein